MNTGNGPRDDTRDEGRDEGMEELLGAYALDAVDEQDRARVDGYVARSPAAQRALDELRETAAMLALVPSAGEPAPADLWSRIAGEIEPGAASEATVVPMEVKRRPFSPHVVAPFSVAAAIIIVLLAVQVVHLRGQVDNLKATGPVASAALFDRATGVPGAKVASLSGGNTALARIVVLPDGTGYLVNKALAPLPPTRTYQLWALVGSPSKPTVISAGVLGSAPRAAAFNVSPEVVGFALTEEHTGGVVSSHNPPIATADLA